MPSNEHLCYSFRTQSEKVKKHKNDCNNYVYDLGHTLLINLQMIEAILPTIQFKNKISLKKPQETLKNIIDRYHKYEELKKLKEQARTKILLDNQIQEEIKRGIKENTNYFNDQKYEIHENIQKKNIAIKKFQKKFNEVEIYIQRESQKYSKYKKQFYEFEITPFLIENEQLIYYKNELYTILKAINIDVKAVMKENLSFKRKVKLIESQEFGRKNKSNDKYNELVILYSNKNSLLMKQKNNLQRFYDMLIGKLQAKNSLSKTINYNFEEEEEQKKNGNEYEFDEEINTNVSKIEKRKGLNGWDISCIEQSDD